MLYYLSFNSVLNISDNLLDPHQTPLISQCFTNVTIKLATFLFNLRQMDVGFFQSCLKRVGLIIHSMLVRLYVTEPNELVLSLV